MIINVQNSNCGGVVFTVRKLVEIKILEIRNSLEIGIVRESS